MADACQQVGRAFDAVIVTPIGQRLEDILSQIQPP
jgi:hypothetical protein